MTKLPRLIKPLLPLVLVLAPLGATAQTCPDLGIPDPARAATACDKLQAILNAPYKENATRGNNAAGTAGPLAKKLMALHPELAEAYRADPQKTMELIELIRKSGGAVAN